MRPFSTIISLKFNSSHHLSFFVSLNQVRVILTDHARHFISEATLARLSELGVRVFVDQDEWNSWQKRGDPVLHIEVL
jgi:phosphopantothenoylcysteine decarboxylase